VDARAERLSAPIPAARSDTCWTNLDAVTRPHPRSVAPAQQKPDRPPVAHSSSAVVAAPDTAAAPGRISASAGTAL
jgi:hypothetical protein